MEYSEKEIVKKLQLALNAAGEKLTADGVPGPVTKGVLSKYDIQMIATKLAIANPPKDPVIIPSGDWFGAPWVGANIDLLGLYETDARLNARYVPEWPLEGMDKSYDDLGGAPHAWCILRGNADRRKVGAKQSGDPAASSGSGNYWSYKCPFWFGSGLDIEHIGDRGQVTGRHWAEFLYWIDQKNMICATLDGNRGNRFAVNITDLSGRKGTDRLHSGPRWSIGWPDGQFVSKDQVLARYPQLKITGSSGSSTT